VLLPQHLRLQDRLLGLAARHLHRALLALGVQALPVRLRRGIGLGLW